MEYLKNVGSIKVFSFEKLLLKIFSKFVRLFHQILELGSRQCVVKTQSNLSCYWVNFKTSILKARISFQQIFAHLNTMPFISDPKRHKISHQAYKNSNLIHFEIESDLTVHIEAKIKKLIIKPINLYHPFRVILIYGKVFKICLIYARYYVVLCLRQLFRPILQEVWLGKIELLDFGFDAAIAIYQMCHIMLQLLNIYMKEQSQQSNQDHGFMAVLKKVHDLLEEEQFQRCQQELYAASFKDQSQAIEIDSLKGYLLCLQRKYQEALVILNQCLQKRPYHLVSMKRRALVLQKLGEHDECIKQFQNCLYFEPESKSILNKIKRLTLGSAKSLSASSDNNTYEEKASKQQKDLVKQQKKSKNQSVKFGNFEIIQIAATEDSDEHFAIIRDQISKLSEKKPKKSILKDPMSASIFKQKPKQKDSTTKIQQKIENAQEKTTKIEKTNQHEKPILKKKAKSVTFKGDTNIQDFN